MKMRHLLHFPYLLGDFRKKLVGANILYRGHIEQQLWCKLDLCRNCNSVVQRQCRHANGNARMLTDLCAIQLKNEI